MEKSLFSKIAAMFTVIITISFIIMAAALSFWFQKYYFNEKKNEIMNEANMLAPYIETYLSDNKDSSATNSMASNELTESIKFISYYFNSEILLGDNNGFINLIPDNKYKKILYSQFFSADINDLAQGKVVEKNSNYNGILSSSVHVYEIPIMSHGIYVATMLINIKLNDLHEPLKTVSNVIWILAIIAIIISCIVIYYFTKKIIIKPLGEINKVAGKIAKGEVDKRVKIHAHDEIGKLAESFNSMADSLEEVEKKRREFISNVSHEIRSPITSIKGFIGGILDGIIPENKQRYYLSITNDEIGRLTRLVNDLLDLSTIESGRFKLNVEKININEIIKVSVIKFETRIKEKNVKVDVCFNRDVTYAEGDKDRVTQIVNNLIDNALKYVKESGKININTKLRGSKVLVSVYNNGPSIAPEDLPHIWERFYKSDKSRTSKVSTGLGLPIVRTILTQLGQDIWVDNKDDGVMFTFTLNKL